MGTAGRSSATFLPEGRARPAAGWAGADAADLLFAAVVRAGRRGRGGRAVRQPGVARLCRHRSVSGDSSGRDDGAELPPLVRAARLDSGSVRRGRCDAGGARLVDAPGNNRRRRPREGGDHRRPAFDQEQKQGARPGDAPDQEGQPVALRDEGAYRGRCRLGGGAHGYRHRCQRGRYQSGSGLTARPGDGCLRRCRLHRGGQAARI